MISPDPLLILLEEVFLCLLARVARGWNIDLTPAGREFSISALSGDFDSYCLIFTIDPSEFVGLSLKSSFVSGLCSLNLTK